MACKDYLPDSPDDIRAAFFTRRSELLKAATHTEKQPMSISKAIMLGVTSPARPRPLLTHERRGRRALSPSRARRYGMVPVPVNASSPCDRNRMKPAGEESQELAQASLAARLEFNQVAARTSEETQSTSKVAEWGRVRFGRRQGIAARGDAAAESELHDPSGGSAPLLVPLALRAAAHRREELKFWGSLAH